MPTHTHQQNGTIESKHRHIVDINLTLLAQSQMPLRFWDEAFNTACYLINKMPSRTIDNHTPMHRLLGTHPDYSLLRIFGCAYWPNLRPYNSRKLNFRTKQYVFIGYNSSHKGYKCFDRSTGRVYISRGVAFDETIFPFANQSLSKPQSPKTTHLPTILPTLINNTKYTEFSLISTVSAEKPLSIEPAIVDSHVSDI